MLVQNGTGEYSYITQHIDHSQLWLWCNISSAQKQQCSVSARGKAVQDICETTKCVSVDYVVACTKLNWKEQSYSSLLVDVATFSSFRLQKFRAPIKCKIREIWTEWNDYRIHPERSELFLKCLIAGLKEKASRKWNRLNVLEYTQKLVSIRAYRRDVLCPQGSPMVLSSINWSKGKCHQ